jgi:hypothetical protein
MWSRSRGCTWTRAARRTVPRVLAAATTAETRQQQVRMPNPRGACDGWGLGWALYDWDGRQVYGHDGDLIGQSGSLRVVPDAGVAVALLTNTDRSSASLRTVFTELLGELCDVTVPPPLAPPADPPEVDLYRHAGVYERVGSRTEATVRDGQLMLRVTRTDDLADLWPAVDLHLVPLSEDVLLGRRPDSSRWSSYLFYSLSDGRTYVHDGSRATAKVG